MSKILAANFKTNHTRASTLEYITKLDTFMSEIGYTDNVYLFPPATALDNFNLKNNIHIGTQNAYPTIKGSFTGEIGAEQLKEFNIKTLLIGHSERRHILKETQNFIAEKYKWFAEIGFKILYCIGEPLEVRETGDKAVRQYLVEQLEGIDTSYENLVLAYEPVWAIGTGKTATSEIIKTTHSMIKEMVEKPLLYGGSVKPQNLEKILAVDSCDGVLIGTASWDIESMVSMLKIVKNIK